MNTSSRNQALPAPSVKYAVGDQLDPENVPASGTHVLCEHDFNANQRIDIFWVGKEVYRDFKVTNDNDKQVSFPITKSLVEENLGSDIAVFYSSDGVSSNTLKLKLYKRLSIERGEGHGGEFYNEGSTSVLSLK